MGPVGRSQDQHLSGVSFLRRQEVEQASANRVTGTQEEALTVHTFLRFEPIRAPRPHRGLVRDPESRSSRGPRLTLTLSHSHSVSLSLCLTLTLSHSHSASLSLCLNLTLSHSASLSLCLTLTLYHSNSASLSSCLTLTMSHSV